MENQMPDLPEIPRWVIAVADVRGPWRLRARVVMTIARYCLHLLVPWSEGGKLYIVRAEELNLEA